MATTIVQAKRLVAQQERLADLEAEALHLTEAMLARIRRLARQAGVEVAATEGEARTCHGKQQHETGSTDRTPTAENGESSSTELEEDRLLAIYRQKARRKPKRGS